VKDSLHCELVAIMEAQQDDCVTVESVRSLVERKDQLEKTIRELHEELQEAAVNEKLKAHLSEDLACYEAAICHFNIMIIMQKNERFYVMSVMQKMTLVLAPSEIQHRIFKSQLQIVVASIWSTCSTTTLMFQVVNKHHQFGSDTDTHYL